MEGVARVDSYLFGFLKPVKRRAADPLHPLPQSGTPFEGGLRVRATVSPGGFLPLNASPGSTR